MLKEQMKLQVLVIILTYAMVGGVTEAQLAVGFYAQSCPAAEAVVRAFVRASFASDPNTSPILLRLHFHDCFVQGCDGSILIDKGPNSEMHAFGHQGVRGFDVIEGAKAQLESLCSRTVSCADIVAMAAREAISLANGPFYEVETGRRDGMFSNISMADNMPDVTDSIQQLRTKFFEKGLSDKDLVVLNVAHTIGTTACFFMTQRLYNFSPGGGSDPSINPAFLSELKTTCPQNGDVNVRLPIDRGSGQIFDRQILQNIRSGFAVLQSDARLYENAATKSVVDSYFGLLRPFIGPSFEADFATSMVRMGRIGVNTGNQGTIRRVCSAFN